MDSIAYLRHTDIEGIEVSFTELLCRQMVDKDANEERDIVRTARRADSGSEFSERQTGTELKEDEVRVRSREPALSDSEGNEIELKRSRIIKRTFSQ